MSEDEFKILKTLKLPLTIAIHYQNLSSGKNKCLAQKLHVRFKKTPAFFGTLIQLPSFLVIMGAASKR